METKPFYDFELEKLKFLSDKTPEEKSEKLEQIKIFRMEVMLDSAKCAEQFTNQITENPHMSLLEFQSTMMDSKYLAHPEVVQRFALELDRTRKVVLSTIDKLKESAEANNVDSGSELFSLLAQTRTGKFAEPAMPPVLDETYPLALSLEIRSIFDYNKIVGPGSAAGGFYSENKNVYDRNSFDLISFPLIVVHNQPRKRHDETLLAITEHEQGHAEQRSFINSLEQSGREVVWSKISPTVLKNEIGAILRKGESIDSESVEYKKILSYSLEKAKDEFLAEYKAKGSEVDEFLPKLKRSQGGYDYFKGLGISADTQLYKDLCDSYFKALDENTGSALEVMRAYFFDFELDDRFNNFRWVLAQIPLKDWKTQLEGTLFSEEARIMISLNKEFKLQKNLDLRDECDLYMGENQDKAYIPFLKEILRKVELRK